jgi:hypothetical protein
MLAALLVVAAAAAAGPDRLAVVPLEAPADLAFTGRAVAATVAEEAAKLPGFEVVGPDALEAALGREGARALARCAADVACLAERGRAAGATRFVAGWIARAGDSYRVLLVHGDAAGEKLASVERLVPVASRRLRAEVAAAVPALLRGDADRFGTLRVVTDEPGATVFLDGVFAGATPLEKLVRPGQHRVEVKRTGHADQDPAFVVVPAGGTVEHRVRLYALPPGTPAGQAR